MKKRMKRMVGLILCLVMVISLLPVAFADTETSGICGDNLIWMYDESGKLTISGTGAMTNYREYGAAPWFSKCSSVKTIVIGDGVTSIGNYAFYGCYNVTSVTMPDSLTTIGKDAFSDCSWLTSITIPDSVTTIGEQAFYYCESLTGITIPDSVTTIEERAFGYCENITSITIPVNVNRIGWHAFYGTGFYENQLNWENKLIYLDGWLLDAKKDISGDVEVEAGTRGIADNIFQGNDGITGLIIPDSVTSDIGDWAFDNCDNLENVTIGNGVTRIDEYAFYGCDNLTSVTIGTGVTYIGELAFHYCPKLTEIVIPGSVSSIGKSAFSDCTSLTSVTIGDGVISIGEYAFDSCTSLTGIVFPDSITNIGDRAFEYCTSLNSVIFGEGLTSIGVGAFEGCSKVDSVTIPKSVTSIGAGAFSSCSSLNKIEVDKGNAVFCSKDGILYNADETELVCYPRGKAETSYTVPSGTVKVCDRAFSGCASLISITIPQSVISIGDGVFSGCTSLSEIKVDNGNRMFCSEDGILYNADKTEIVCYPAGKKEKMHTIPSKITKIWNYAFATCKALNSITIPDSVTSIGNHAFLNCASLKSIEIPAGVTVIEPYTFHRCTSLTELLIGKNVTSIRNYAFCGCSSLLRVTIPASVETIGSCAFYNCESITDVYYGGTEEEWATLVKNTDRENQDLLDATIHFKEDPIEVLTTEAKTEISAIGDGSNEAAAKLAEINAKIDEAAADESLSFEEVQTRIEALKKEAKMSCGVLNLRFQITAGTISSSEKSDIRFISTVDSLNYKETGFYITINGVKKRISTKYVYTDLVSNSGSSVTNYTPSSIFAESEYFTTYSLWNIPNEAFDTPITVQAFVVRYDGKEILGVEKTRAVRNFIR